MSEHLRHHEVRLLRNQRVLLVDQLDPVLDHFRGAAAAWKWKKNTVFGSFLIDFWRLLIQLTYRIQSCTF